MRWLLLLVTLASCGGDAASEIELQTDENVRTYGLALDGDGFVAAWTTTVDGRPTDRLWFARIGGDGELVLAPQPVIDVDRGTTNVRAFAIPGGYAVWYRKDDASIAALLVDDNGDARGGEQVVGLTESTLDLGVVWTGERFALVETISSVATIAMFGADLAKQMEHTIDADTNAQVDASLAWVPDDNQLIAVWRELGNIRSARLAADGSAAGTGADIAGSGDQFQPRAAGASGVIVGWLEAPGRRAQIATTPAGGTLVPRNDLIEDNRIETLDIDVAADGTRGLVTWRSDTTGALTQIFVGELDLATGVALTGVHGVTSPRFPYAAPRAVAGPAHDAVIYEGAVAGQRRVYVNILR